MAIPTLSSSDASMSSHRFALSGLLLVLVAALPVEITLAETNSPQCPREVATQQSLTNSYDGWKAGREDTRFPHVSIRISEGDPSETVWLAPTSSKNPSVQYWLLPKSQRGYWLSCGYGSTSVYLSTRLPAGTSQCTVWFDKGYLPPVAVKYECK